MIRTLDDLARNPRALLTLEQVTALTGLLPSKVLSHAHQCQFPQPLLLPDRSQKWVKAEVCAWLLAQGFSASKIRKLKTKLKQETGS